MRIRKFNEMLTHATNTANMTSDQIHYKLERARIRQYTHKFTTPEKVYLLYLLQNCNSLHLRRSYDLGFAGEESEKFPVLSRFINHNDDDRMMEPKNYHLKEEESYEVDRLFEKLFYQYTIETLPDFHDVDPIFQEVRDIGHNVEFDIKLGSRSNGVSFYKYTISFIMKKSPQISFNDRWSDASLHSGVEYFQFQEELSTIFDRLQEDYKTQFYFRFATSIDQDTFIYDINVTKKHRPTI